MADASPFEDHDHDSDDDEWQHDDDATRFLNALNANTEAEQWMHVTARVALLNLLSNDPTVDALYWRWMQTISFGRAIFAFVEQLGRCAEAFNMENANEFAQFLRNIPADGKITIRAADPSEAERITEALNVSVAEANRLLAELVASSRSVETSFLVEDAVALVRDEWKLPWPWLALELVHVWLLRMHHFAFGTRSVITYSIESNELLRPAPQIDFRFATKPGETIGEAIERFVREMDEAVVVPLLNAATPLPKGRTTDDEIAKRYVEWWYRKTILHESIRSIAGKDDGKRSLVRYGIDQAERWLSLANCAWKDQEAA